MPEFTQQYDGEWMDITDRVSHICCDCGLTHKTKYTILEGRILEMVSRDKKTTANFRRMKDIKASIKKLKGK